MDICWSPDLNDNNEKPRIQLPIENRKSHGCFSSLSSLLSDLSLKVCVGGIFCPPGTIPIRLRDLLITMITANVI